MHIPPILILLGPPGSGKGTQAKELSKKLKYYHLSTGDLLRNELQKETILAKKIRTYIDHGELVPDQVIVNILLSSMFSHSNSPGIILDGFPRTLHQAELLFNRCGIEHTTAILLEVNDEIITKRIIWRRSCEQCGQLYHLKLHPPQIAEKCDICGGKLLQRSDDLPAVIKKRLAIYHQEMPPVINFYKSHRILITIRAAQSQTEITASILAKLKSLKL